MVMNAEEETLNLSRLDICMHMHENLFNFTNQIDQQAAVLQFIIETLKLSIEDIDDAALTKLKTAVHPFVQNLIRRYRANSKHIKRLVLEDTITKDLPDSLKNAIKFVLTTRSPYVRKTQKKAFGDKSIRGQYLEAKKLRDTFEPGAIHLAAGQNLTKTGKKDARFVFVKASSETGFTAAKAREAICNKDQKAITKITSSCALGFLLNQNLTRSQYNGVRAICKENGADIWPSYKEIQNAKEQCRPEEIEVSDHSAFVPLQQLLHHTTSRILELDSTIETTLQSLAEENGNQVIATLTYKYGLDGSGSHQRQMQPDQAGDHSEVKNLVATQLVPIQISVFAKDNDQTIWECSRPNNPHSCRPLRLSFEIENKETSITENERLLAEIENLESYIVSKNPKISIAYLGVMSLVDGKVVSNLTNGNTTRCTVCDATRSEMAKNEGPFTAVSDQRLSFGISPLHFGLRAFEALLHIAYKQDVKKFISRSDEEKEKISKRTQIVKDAFLTELGLKVDRPKEGGSGGNTNTGNVVRKAFKNAQATARICCVSTILVSNLDTIWRTLSSGKSINLNQFDIFCKETLAQYMSDCGWYSLPPTLHKVLVHGKEIIEATPITIGASSEEGSEANAKFARKFVKHHTRKTSQKETMFDLFHRLLDISDPCVVAQSYVANKKKIQNIPADMALLIGGDTLENNQNEPNVSICDMSLSDQSFIDE
jgi:hypothetical protein